MFLLLFLMYTLSYCPQADYPTGFEVSPAREIKKTVVSSPSASPSAEFYLTWVSSEEIQHIAVLAQTKKANSEKK
jgi:hypothetical protein